MHLAPGFVSVGVNRIVNALDWGDNGLIAYGGHWIVCIYDPVAAEVVGTLTGHKGQVNCVKWLPASVCPAGVSLLLSGAADNSIRLWAWHGKGHNQPWQCVTELKAHQSPVTSLALHQLDSQTLLLASTSADPQLQLWHCTHDGSNTKSLHRQHEHLQEQLQASFGAAAWQQQPPIHVGTQIQHCVALASLPEDPQWLVMATGGTDSSVRLFVRAPAGIEGSAPLADAAALSDSSPAQHEGFKLQCQLKGHENWVRGVAFKQVQEPNGSVSLLLASAAQDRYGRVWCITTDSSRSSVTASASGSTAAPPDALRQLITRYAPRPHLSTLKSTYWVTLEALLVGHEDWLHSISWRPVAAATAGLNGSLDSASSAAAAATHLPSRQDLTLLTTSQDRSMMLWTFDAPSGLWISESAVGDAGATCLGFYGGAFGPHGDWLVAHGFTGALHLWKQQHAVAESSSAAAASGVIVSSSSDRCTWLPQHALGGHYGAVVDLSWGADGACLQSVGTDQTARLFTGIAGHWFELARTQVHGHDFSCIAPIPTPAAQQAGSGSSPTICPSLLYVSGSEEKVIRVFEAPQAFIDTLTAIRNQQSADAAAAVAAALTASRAASTSANSNNSTGRGRAVGASVSALGLSNKALYVEDQGDAGVEGSTAGSTPGFGSEAYNEGPDFVPCASPSVVSGPPLEEHLAQNTLWPEIRKLYGHGNDVFCVCSSPNGRIIASACKAQSAGAAPIWVWEVGSWRAVTQLPGHTLTVTQLQFSPDGRFLLAGSRDRSFSVWRVPDKFVQSGADSANNAAAEIGGDEAFQLVTRLQKSHSRIVWGVSWSHDSRLFVTGSRDQTVKVWDVDDCSQPQQKPVASLPAFSAGVTAVALAPAHVCVAAGAPLVLAVGLEDGQVQVWSVDTSNSSSNGSEAKMQQVWVSQPWQQHATTVRRLVWAPEVVNLVCGKSSDVGVQLASCGEDHSVRVYGVQF